MKPKMHGWKEGVKSEDLNGFGGVTYKKGDTVRYKRVKTLPNKDGYKMTDYEWHYLDENNYNLVRTTKRIIEGLEKIIEPNKK